MSVLPFLLTGVGVYFLVRLRGFFIMHPVRTLRKVIRALRRAEGRGRRAFVLALSGTLGVGNLSGVALALLLGGAGSLFWMLVASVIACALKYAEVLLTKDVGTAQGMAGVLRRLLPWGRGCAALYACACVALSLSMGAMLQSRAVTTCAEGALGVRPAVVAAVLVVALLLVILGGERSIEGAVGVAIPLAAVGYVVLCVATLILRWQYIPAAAALILEQVCSVRSAGCGILGMLASQAVRRGFACGLLSNEAGAGTSSLAHIRSESTTPCEQGLIGLCEVACDAGICILTGMALLVSGGCFIPQSSTEPMVWLSDAFSQSLGAWCRPVLLLCVCAFAFATVVCWYYYGLRCMSFAARRVPSWMFAVLYLCAVFFGGVLLSQLTVRIVDLLLGVLCILTLSALLFGRERICTIHFAENGRKQRKGRSRSVDDG